MAHSQPTRAGAFATRNASPKGRKARYSSPVLRTYGSVNALTMGMGGTVVDFMGIAMAGMSDRRAKERVVRVGTHPLGIGLYLFDYKPQYRDSWGRGRQFGVMADEVERVLPEAIAVAADGFRMVNYAMLGIRIACREPESKT
jgi:hypothetical protein